MGMTFGYGAGGFGEFNESNTLTHNLITGIYARQNLNHHAIGSTGCNRNFVVAIFINPGVNKFSALLLRYRRSGHSDYIAVRVALQSHLGV